MNPWALGLCMLILFATLNHMGRIALEILLSLAFTAAFFLTLLRELEQQKSDEDEAEPTDETASPSDEEGDGESGDSPGIPQAA